MALSIPTIEGKATFLFLSVDRAGQSTLLAASAQYSSATYDLTVDHPILAIVLS
jgi:hypothetical protein